MCQVFTVEAVEVPVVQVVCAQAFVEVDSVGVPVQHCPFVAPSAALDGLLSGMLEERVADPFASELLQHEKVFQVECREGAEGRVCLEDERIADDPPPYFGKENLETRPGTKGIFN